MVLIKYYDINNVVVRTNKQTQHGIKELQRGGV